MRRYWNLPALVLVAALGLPAGSGNAQIPNAGFENWTSGTPDGWTTSNASPYITITQSADYYTGISSIQGSVVYGPGGYSLPALAASGTDGKGFPISGVPSALHGWYKFTSVAEDAFVVNVGLLQGGTPIGSGSFITSTTTSVWTEFLAMISYGGTGSPDSAIITLQAAGYPGSTFIVDALSFTGLTDVKQPVTTLPGSFGLHQNYPNPFNPTTLIGYDLPVASHVTLKVFNIIGQEEATLADGERPAGAYVAEFNGLNLPSGAYIYRLEARQTGGAKSYTATKRLLLVK